MNSLSDIVSYFKNILDVPEYYVIQSNFRDNSLYIFDCYARIGNIDIYIYTYIPSFRHNNAIINDRLVITNGIIQYELLLPIDNFVISVINDIIKYFEGEFYEKKPLCCS